MHANAELIHKFYSSFQQRDAKGMVACYHPDIVFSDPVFRDLSGERAGAMWRMLCARGKDLVVEFQDVRADETTGAAHWEAWYTFSTGRKVRNIIDASFQFREGRILRPVDTFDLRDWAAQALGLTGRLLGGTSLLQNRTRAATMKGLEEFWKAEARQVSEEA